METPEQIHQQTASNIDASLKEILGSNDEKPEVIPTTDETRFELGEKIKKLVDENYIDTGESEVGFKTGKQRVGKMNPDSEVRLK